MGASFAVCLSKGLQMFSAQFGGWTCESIYVADCGKYIGCRMLAQGMGGLGEVVRVE